MHIHLPKPLHGWREFLGEVGVIVIGVLIALGFEQTVEAWHWHKVVSEEREALRDEIGHLRSAVLGRLEIEPCHLGRLAEVKEVIRRHDANEPLGIAGPVGRPLYPPTARPIWDLAVADQSLAHMKLSEKRRFIEAYDWVSIYEKITSDERAAFRGLQSLNHAEKLTTADWSIVRDAYEHAAESHGVIATSSSKWLVPFATLASETPKVSVRHAPSVEAFCTSMLSRPRRP